MCIPLLGRPLWVVFWGDYPFLASVCPCRTNSDRAWWPTCPLQLGEVIRSPWRGGERERRAEMIGALDFEEQQKKGSVELEEKFTIPMAFLCLNNGKSLFIFCFNILSLWSFRTEILALCSLGISSIKQCLCSTLMRAGTQWNGKRPFCVTQVFLGFSINQDTVICLRIRGWGGNTRKFFLLESLRKSAFYCSVNLPAS